MKYMLGNTLYRLVAGVDARYARTLPLFDVHSIPFIFSCHRTPLWRVLNPKNRIFQVIPMSPVEYYFGWEFMRISGQIENYMLLQ